MNKAKMLMSYCNDTVSAKMALFCPLPLAGKRIFYHEGHEEHEGEKYGFPLTRK